MFSYVFFYICLFVFWPGLFSYARTLVGWYDSQTQTKFGHINTNLILQNNFYLIAQIILHRKTHKYVT